ncbi:hypothetical protein ACLKA7_001001 [Drosophila subpalustris]
MNLMRSEENLPAALANADVPEGTCKGARRHDVNGEGSDQEEVEGQREEAQSAATFPGRKGPGRGKKPGGTGPARQVRSRQPRMSDPSPRPSVEVDYDKIFQKMEDIIERKLSVMNPFHTQTQSSGVPPPDFPRSSPRTSSRSISNLSPEKVTQMIQNWGVKFDGAPKGQTVQEFLYRVKSLTEDCLQGDFSIICKNLHVLLVGKARDWYWRFRKEHSEFGWSEFCEAIRSHYQDNKDDDLILEEIRSRKQRDGETFDSLYDDVITLVSRMAIPLDEYRLSQIESPPDNEESFPLTQIQKKRLDGTMCRLVDELIPADLKHCVFGYLDDVCVVSEDFDTHLSVLL